MRKKCVVFDVDQVLLDYISRLRSWFNKKFDKKVEGFPDKWDLTEWLGLKSSAETLEVLNEFSLNKDFSLLAPMSEAGPALTELLREGYALICVTACGLNPHSHELRKANLEREFGDIFDEIHFVDFGETKGHILSDLQCKYDIVAFVDDKPANILDAYFAAGIENTILMKSPHNREFRAANPGLDVAFSLYDCKQLIDRFSKKDV